MNHLAGGRLFPGEHQRASFRIDEAGDRVALTMSSADGRVQVGVAGRVVEELPARRRFPRARSHSTAR